MKKFPLQFFWIFFALVFGLGIAVFFVSSARAADEGMLVVEILERSDCAHCMSERSFLESISKTRGDLSIRFYDVNGEGKDLFRQVTERAGLPKATPITIAGGVIMQGFDQADTTGKRLMSLIEASKGKPQVTFKEYLAMEGSASGISESVSGASCGDGSACPLPDAAPTEFRLPIVGKVVDVSAYSLPTLAVVLGFIDGFNPCAMWVLVTFLVMLAHAKSRRRMVQVAGLFVLAEAVMYYLILNVWMTAWNFVGMDRIVTPTVGVVAILGGLFFLYEWYTSLGTEMACRIVDAERRSKIISQVKSFVTGEFTLLVALSVIGLAFSVNVIEFACSIGIPQAFTKIIELNHLGFLGTQGLMFTYIIFYMIDDLLVFGLAIWSFDRLHLTEKYSKWSALLGGILMIFLGYLLMFYPAALSNLK